MKIVAIALGFELCRDMDITLIEVTDQQFHELVTGNDGCQVLGPSDLSFDPNTCREVKPPQTVDGTFIYYQ